MTQEFYELAQSSFGENSDNLLQYIEKRQATYDCLSSHGYPVLPVAPAQDAYEHPKVDKGDGTKEWQHCPLTSQFTPLPAFTGKNPSYLDRDGKPRIVNHRQYQSKLPDADQLAEWFTNPANGIGTLGGWNGTVWLDFDVKQFDSQEDLNQAFRTLLSRYPELDSSWIEQTQSGGYRLAVRVKTPPTFTNFAFEPGGKHRGEALVLSQSEIEG